MSELLTNLIDRTRSYLAGDILARELEGYVVARIQVVSDSGDVDANALADEINNGFILLGEEIITLYEFHENLRKRLRQIEAVQV